MVRKSTEKLQEILGNLLNECGTPYSFFLVPPGRFLGGHLF
jgi:hypothetical protein